MWIFNCLNLNIFYDVVVLEIDLWMDVVDVGVDFV